MSERPNFDFLVLGSGVAGLFYALRVAERGRVAIVTKRLADDSATARAQGGIAAVLGSDDSLEAHVSDTQAASNGALGIAVGPRSLITDSQATGNDGDGIRTGRTCGPG